MSLLDCVRNALLLLEHRSRTLDLQTDIDVPAGLLVRAEANRLEQVLVNLFGNAIDAMQNEQERRLRVQAKALDGGRRVLVRVQDSGPGVGDGRPSASLRALLHHQAGRRGLGPGPGHFGQDRQ